MNKIFDVLERNYWVAFIFCLVFGGFIFLVSSITFGKGGGGGFALYPILYHMGVFFLFSLFLFITLVRGKFRYLFIIGIILAIGYAFIDEYHQSIIPGREPSMRDIYLDGIGIVFAFVIYNISIQYRRLNNKGP